MRQHLITFFNSELRGWDEILSCSWLITTTSKGEEHLLIGDIAVTDAIKGIQFDIAYLDTHRELRDYTISMHQINTAADWKKFEKQFENCLKKVLKASDAENKLFALKSCLWNKMANKLIETIKTEKKSSPMAWHYTFSEPYFKADVSIRVDFSESKITEAATRWLTTRTNYNQDKDEFGNYLLYYICGTLTYKYSTQTNPDLINCKIEEMGIGDFLEVLDKCFCNPSRIAIKTNLKAFLIDKFWIADYRLPPTTVRILQELEATNKQKEQIANEFETLFKLSSFPIDNYIEESKMQIATNALKNRLSDFSVRTTKHYTSVIENPFTVCEVACDFSNYRFKITLNMKSEFVVGSFEIKVDSEGKTIFNTTFKCCEGNDGEFVAIMSRYLSDVYMAKALKRHIEYEIERCTGREITWRT
jgi:adenine-specific DNA methylase